MKTGMIGLGAMGRGMALNLSKAGHLHRVWNRTRGKAAAVAEETGAGLAPSPAALAAACELTVICVSRDEDVLEMVEQIAASINPGAVVADVSTVSGATAELAAAMLVKKGADFLDCPVTGGVEGANNGTLAMMVGGEAQVLARVEPALASMASFIALIGPTGSGQACKAVNQTMIAGINQGVTEALAFGEAIGLDMEKVMDVASRGGAGNWFLSHRGKTMLADDNKVGFKLSLHHKDLAICKAMAQGKVELPLADQTIADYETLMEQGYGDEDISALYRLKRPGGKQA